MEVIEIKEKIHKNCVVIVEDVMELFCSKKLTLEDFEVYIMLFEKFVNEVSQEEINKKSKYDIEVSYDELLEVVKEEYIDKTIERFLEAGIFTRAKGENSYYFRIYNQFEVICTIH